MKKTIKLLCTWAASLLLAGCSSEADMSKLMDWQSNPDAVHFTASVNNATTRTNPAATDDAQTIFNNDDKVTVSNNGNQADYAYNGESWAPAETNKYLLWDRSNLTFNCWYPAGGNNTATVGYLNEDQSSTDLMAKSDYMNATTVLQTADEALNFSLERKTARLILKISGITDVSGTIKHVCIVSKAFTAADETQTIDIKPLTQNGESEIGSVGTTYTALVIPGEVVAKFYFTDDMSDTKPLTMTTNVNEAGSSYIYNLNVIKRTKIEVTGITEGPWTASGTTTGDITPIPYVTFKAAQPQTFKMTAQYYTISGLQYSVNNGEWKTVVENEEVTFGGTNGTLRLRGTNTNGTASTSSKFSTIIFTDPNVNVACTGDIRTLLNWKSYSTVDTQNARFCYLFSGCKELTSAPELPATTLADYCYKSMFRGCTKLNTAPKLKATTLADYCYDSMFMGCTKLNTAPELPATTLANYCYESMFEGCTKLNTAPELPATTLADYCYYSMFNGCTNLKTVPTLSAMKMFSGVYWSMFQGCTSLENAPDLPATELADYCYAFMFYGCTKLNKVPNKLPAKIMANSCYNKMFYNCTSLTDAPDLPATTLAKGCYDSMFWGCKGLTEAPKLNATSLKESCYNAMFWGCTSLTAAPDLPATTLAKNCYAVMFRGCTSLETGPKELPAEILAERCYNSMFSGCTSLKTVPALPATELAVGCYISMFSSCTSLVNAPALPAMTLAENCYQGMFSSCTNLSSVKMLASNVQITSDKFKNWLYKAGTKATIRSLTLTDQTAYDAMKTNSLLPTNWQAGNCTVNAADGSDIK